MFDKLKAAEERFLYLEEKLASPDVAQNQEEFTKIMKEYKNLTPIIEKYREQKKLTDDMEGAKLLMEEGGEFYDLALEEYKDCKDKLTVVEEELVVLLLHLKNLNL